MSTLLLDVLRPQLYSTQQPHESSAPLLTLSPTLRSLRAHIIGSAMSFHKPTMNKMINLINNYIGADETQEKMIKTEGYKKKLMMMSREHAVLRAQTGFKVGNGIIDSLDENKVKMLVDAYLSQTLSSAQIIHHAGKHMPVFELVDFPGHIFKLLTPKLAQEMLANIERCQALVKQHALNHCTIPSAKIIPIFPKQFNVIIFVVDKIEGLSHEAAREAAEVAYESFQDSEKQAKWKEFFRQAAEFIALSGYWDTSWASILLMNNGFGFVDFERVKVDDQGYNQETGLSRLRDLAPSEFFDMISEIAKKHKINLQTNLFASSEMRKKDLEQRSAVRKWHREHNITQAKEIDTGTALYQGLNGAEKRIINEFNARIERQATAPWNKDNLIQQRELHWQPFLTNSCQKYRSEFEKNRSECEKALQDLNKKGLVCNWSTEENSFEPYLVLYKIYL